MSPLSGIPYSNPLPTGGFAPVPSYPYGTPVQIGPPPSNDLLPPPGSFTIPSPSPGVPLAPPKSTNDVKALPPLGGGTVTGDPKK